MEYLALLPTPERKFNAILFYFKAPRLLNIFETVHVCVHLLIRKVHIAPLQRGLPRGALNPSEVE